jgi:hypothetical protein
LAGLLSSWQPLVKLCSKGSRPHTIKIGRGHTRNHIQNSAVGLPLAHRTPLVSCNRRTGYQDSGNELSKYKALIFNYYLPTLSLANLASQNVLHSILLLAKK